MSNFSFDILHDETLCLLTTQDDTIKNSLLYKPHTVPNISTGKIEIIKNVSMCESIRVMLKIAVNSSLCNLVIMG